MCWAASPPPARRWAQPPRILVTADLDPEALDRLRELGPVEYQSYREHKRVLQRESLVSALRGFEIFVTEIDLAAGRMTILDPADWLEEV